jgi:hypothetical protein
MGALAHERAIGANDMTLPQLFARWGGTIAALARAANTDWATARDAVEGRSAPLPHTLRALVAAMAPGDADVLGAVVRSTYAPESDATPAARERAAIDALLTTLSADDARALMPLAEELEAAGRGRALHRVIVALGGGA